MTSQNDKVDTDSAGAPSKGVGCGALVGLWAVSVVMTLQKPDGKLNVMNQLQKVRASSKDEAVGAAIRVSMEQLPEHQLHCTTALSFSEEPNPAISHAASDAGRSL